MPNKDPEKQRQSNRKYYYKHRSSILKKQRDLYKSSSSKKRKRNRDSYKVLFRGQPTVYLLEEVSGNTVWRKVGYTGLKIEKRLRCLRTSPASLSIRLIHSRTFPDATSALAAEASLKAAWTARGLKHPHPSLTEWFSISAEEAIAAIDAAPISMG